MFNIQEELKKLPDKPGVYIMHDKKDAIIYVGKAISLKNRVRHYFQPGRKVTAKIERMISQIDHVIVLLSNGELEIVDKENMGEKEFKEKIIAALKEEGAANE